VSSDDSDECLCWLVKEKERSSSLFSPLSPSLPLSGGPHQQLIRITEKVGERPLMSTSARRAAARHAMSMRLLSADL